MRRTYRSKKDTGGGLDHRDVLLTVDEKSSVFDAFYIQNIKQTKRELSCTGASTQYSSVASKSRKKKLVKRIVKEAPNDGRENRESVSRSTYLTPDKSIRVNRGEDLFDRLLNSSSTNQITPKEKKEDLFDKICSGKPAKTYGRRKARKVKKSNYYSSDSYDTDKENDSNNSSKNVTDIRAHKLILEKDVPNSPKQQDESINNIVKNLPLLNNLRNSNNSSNSPIISFNYSKKRTKQRPQVQPVLSSTPFRNIRTATSIYKFSPISRISYGENSNYVSVIEENENKTASDKLSPFTDCIKIHDDELTDNSMNLNNSEASNVKIIENIKDNVNSSAVKNVADSAEKGDKDSEEVLNEYVIGDSVHESDPVVSLGGSKASQLFLGFTVISSESDVENQYKLLEHLAKETIKETEDPEVISIVNKSQLEVSATISKSSNSSDCVTIQHDDELTDNSMNFINSKASNIYIIETNNKDNVNSSAVKNVADTLEDDEKDSKEVLNKSGIGDNVHESDLEVSLGGSKPSQLFLGFTVISNESDVGNQYKLLEHLARVTIKETEDPEVTSIINKSELEVSATSSKTSDSSDCIVNPNRTNIDLGNKRRTSKHGKGNSGSSVNSESEELNSFYDSCTSEKFDEVSPEDVKEPVIKVARLDDAVFQEYYEKMPAYASDLSGDEDMDEDSEDNEDSISSDNQSENVQGHYSSDSKMNGQVEIDCDDDSNSPETSTSENSKIELDEETVSPQESKSDSNSMSEDLESNSNDDDQARCFVNTRRRATIKRNSSKLSSENSSSSSECNKTVLSNNKVIVNSPNVNEILVSDDDAKDSQDIKAPASLDTETINVDSDETEEKRSAAGVSFVTTRKSSKKHTSEPSTPDHSLEIKPAIVLQPGKKWERSLSIYRRMTMMNDNFDTSLLETESVTHKGRKYRQSVISTMEMQEGSLHNESISSRRSTFVVKPSRSTIRILKEPNDSRISLCNSTIYDDLKGFLSDDCDDTIVELSKLSIADSDHEITVVESLHEDRFTTARDYVLRRCNQTDAIPFDECYPDTALKNCHKIGEGVYGEVFLWRARDGRARVMKIVPVAGSTKVNGEAQKDFHEIISEIVIAMELSALRTPIADLERQFDEGKDVDALELHAIQNATDAFNEVLAVRCVYGSYTTRLLDLWELYDECKGSENDNPGILPSDQQYIVLELANAGQDLESYQFNSAEQAYALFYQVAFALAVGEEAFQFEHRDLHWGNVLIAPTEQKYATFVVRGRVHRLARCGVAATIIDYSLSRLSLPLAGDAAALYHDLAADDSLFAAVGDYQFEVYRLMRDKLRNDWKDFEPYTNILWLHYTVDKMITALRYKRTNTKIHKHYISKLKAIKNRILAYGSAVQFVLTDIE